MSVQKNWGKVNYIIESCHTEVYIIKKERKRKRKEEGNEERKEGRREASLFPVLFPKMFFFYLGLSSISEDLTIRFISRIYRLAESESVFGKIVGGV